MAVFTLDLDEAHRASLEAHRVRLGARSLAEAVRLLISGPLPSREHVMAVADALGDQLGSEPRVRLPSKPFSVTKREVHHKDGDLGNNALANLATRIAVGTRERVMGKDGKSGAPMLKGWRVLERYDGDKPVWKYEERKP